LQFWGILACKKHPKLKHDSSSVTYYLTRHRVDQKTQRARAALAVYGRKKEVLEDVVEVHRQHGCVPPCRVGSENLRWNVSSGELLFEAVVDLLRLAASLTVPFYYGLPGHRLSSREAKDASFFFVFNIARHSEELVNAPSELSQMQPSYALVLFFDGLYRSTDVQLFAY